MANITYLLGAGASANAIPIVDAFPKRMQKIAQELFGMFVRPSLPTAPVNAKEEWVRMPTPIKKNIETTRALIDDIAWVVAESSKHNTIDALAKKFYLTGDIKNLNRVKHCLISYFMIEQGMYIPSAPDEQFKRQHRIDKRYDNFIQSISRPGMEMMGNVKVLSWNYDLQFELALREYISNGIHTIKETYQLFPKTNAVNSVKDFDINSFSTVKLNGYSFWDSPSTEIFPPTIFDKTFKNNTEFYSEFIEEYNERIHKYRSHTIAPDCVNHFNFAWESDENYEGKHKKYYNNIEIAEKIAAITNTLVVIGYSFPYENKVIDSKLFDKMLPTLDKIYIVDLDPDFIWERIKDNFTIKNHVKYFARRDVSRFFLPSGIKW